MRPIASSRARRATLASALAVLLLSAVPAVGQAACPTPRTRGIAVLDATPHGILYQKPGVPGRSLRREFGCLKRTGRSQRLAGLIDTVVEPSRPEVRPRLVGRFAVHLARSTFINDEADTIWVQDLKTGARGRASGGLASISRFVATRSGLVAFTISRLESTGLLGAPGTVTAQFREVRLLCGPRATTTLLLGSDVDVTSLASSRDRRTITWRTAAGQPRRAALACPRADAAPQASTAVPA